MHRWDEMVVNAKRVRPPTMITMSRSDPSKSRSLRRMRPRGAKVNVSWQIAAEVAPNEKGEAVPGGQGMHALR